MAKILIADFDGTIYTSEKALKKNIDAITNFINNGNKFIVATGRPIHSIDAFEDFMKLDFSYIICNDGGIILDKNLNIINKEYIDSDLVEDIFNYLSTNDKCGNVQIDDGTNYYDELTPNICSIVSNVKDINDAKEIINYLNTTYENRIYAYVSHRWINIMDAKINKSFAIDYLVNLNNYNLDDIYVIGDNYNDYTMIKEYHGFSIASGVDKLKEVSRAEYYEVFDLIEDIEKEVI